jgi:LysM repeat protein
MKKLFFLFFITPLFASAQDKLMVEGVSPGLYITHKVAPKENYYSIGRIYNISPKDIAPFNKLQLEKGLSLGQAIKIPLNNSNFYQSGNASTDEIFVPVYYIVKDKEGLYRVAKNHNDVQLETLKQWNNIKGDAVKNGTKLIVGYLKVKTALSSLAKNGIGSSINSKAMETTVVPVEKPEAAPLIVSKPIVKEETKRAIPTETEKPVTPEPIEIKPVVKEEKIITIPAKKIPKAEPVKTTAVKNSGETGFKYLYESQSINTEPVEATGNAGVFKSTTGWEDKKYYCLFNNATPGTVVKITNPANGKYVYAKVLDLIPDIKKNEGLLIIISNAASDALGAVNEYINCSISYSK